MGYKQSAGWVDQKKATRDRPGADLPVLGSGPERIPTGPYNALIAKHATTYGVPVGLALRQAEQESKFNPLAVNKGSGAAGLFQFMNATAVYVGKLLGLNPKAIQTEPDAAAKAGTYYMGQLYKRFGNWKHAVWAYNWGEGNVAKYLKGVKTTLPEETRLYGLIVVDGLTPAQAKATPRTVR